VTHRCIAYQRRWLQWSGRNSCSPGRWFLAIAWRTRKSPHLKSSPSSLSFLNICANWPRSISRSCSMSSTRSGKSKCPSCTMCLVVTNLRPTPTQSHGFPKGVLCRTVLQSNQSCYWVPTVLIRITCCSPKYCSPHRRRYVTCLNTKQMPKVAS